MITAYEVSKNPGAVHLSLSSGGSLRRVGVRCSRRWLRREAHRSRREPQLRFRSAP